MKAGEFSDEKLALQMKTAQISGAGKARSASEGGAIHAAGMNQDGSDRYGRCALGTRAATSDRL